MRVAWDATRITQQIQPMKQICLHCERTAPDRNLFCQETYCPAEMSPTILDFGEWLGDIEIVKVITVLRSAVVYEATHQQQKVLLKVAHPGEKNKVRLQREARFLAKNHNAHLPTLLPPYMNANIKKTPYGRTMFQGHLLYFFLFTHVEGEPLRAILTQNPQLWINHVVWLMSDLALTINFLHVKKIYHYGLTPEAVLVTIDEKLNVPRLLLCDLGVASDQQNLQTAWEPFFIPPAYTAPELVNKERIAANYGTDVYGLGLLLYELLVGTPTFPYKLASDQSVYHAVLQNHRVQMNRWEDVEKIARLAEQAVHPQPEKRHRNAADVAEELIAYFGRTPTEKPNRWLTKRNLIYAIGILLAIAFLITLLVSLQTIFGQNLTATLPPG